MDINNNENQEITSEDDTISWKVPEYDEYKKTTRWYIIFGVIALILLTISLFTQNFLFAIIVTIASIIIAIRHGEDVNLVDIALSDKGVHVGKGFYDYDKIKHFAIVYKPDEDIKNIYFEFKGVLRPRLSIPLNDLNPLPIRKSLLKYLEEDLDRTNIPLSEQLSRLFRL